MAKRVQKKAPADIWPKAVETFRPLDDYELRQWKDTEPSAFNGWVRVQKYRITIERVEEPKEVLEARLQKLWEEDGNHHHYGPLQSAAAELGIELKGIFGAKRKDRTR